MIVLFAIAAWILTLALVAGLCLAARRGDLQAHSGPLAELVGESLELLVIREVAAHPSGHAPSHPPSQPAARHAVEGTVGSEDFSSRHTQAPGDLALQPG